MRILFVEDEEELNSIGTQQLRAQGHTVWPVTTVAQARDLFEEHAKEIDLFIADQRLPDGTGVGLALEFKMSRSDLNVVVVSGHLTDDDRHILEAAGIPFYYKPLVYSSIVRRFERPPMGAGPSGKTNFPFSVAASSAQPSHPAPAPQVTAASSKPAIAVKGGPSKAPFPTTAPAVEPPKSKGLTRLLWDVVTKKKKKPDGGTDVAI